MTTVFYNRQSLNASQRQILREAMRASCSMRDLTRECKREMPKGASQNQLEEYADLEADAKIWTGKEYEILPLSKISRDAMRPTCLTRNLTPLCRGKQPGGRFQKPLEAHGELPPDPKTVEENRGENRTNG
jgi:hypothetical protein